MNNQWRSARTGRSTYLDSPSISTPFQYRSSLQDAIRPGTVASRVQSLQKLASPSPPRSHPPPIPIPRGEDSRTGFGRRINNRFGKPALQNTNPDEEPRIGAACHSYLGLNTPRVNHDEQHAIANQRTKYARSPGINGQIIPDGMPARIQHDAAAPWSVLSRSNRTRSMGRQVTDVETDAQTGGNISRNQERLTAESSISQWYEEARYLDLYLRKIESRPVQNINSEASNATNSTTRRQSVRDLFKDFGIERPAGLASRETSFDKAEAAKLKRQERQCHVCSRVNSSVHITCSKCNHRLCLQCETLSALPSTQGQEVIANHEQDYRMEELASKENRSNYRGIINEINLKPAEPQTSTSLPSRKPSIRKPDRPSVPAVDSVTLQKKTPRVPKQEQKFPERALATPFLSGSQVPRRVRDSPFLIADQLASNRTLPSRSVETSAKHGLGGQSAPQPRSTRLEMQQGISSSDGNKCSSSTCRATHHGHQPYRHAISCTKTKTHRHVYKDTDNGYSADTSRVEEAIHSRSRISRKMENRVDRHTHKGKPNPRPSRIPRPCARNSQPVSEQEGSEFIECYGYPRTGHSRLGSPVSTGIVGECQHCLHDCHCDSCKSTYHSVRCCVHADHQAMTHHHLTPRNGASIVSEKESSAGEPNDSDKKSSSKPVAPVPAGFDQRDFAVIAKTTRNVSLPRGQGPEKPELVKMTSLPRSKHSLIMVDNETKPPTPPPWVTSPRKQSMTGIATPERMQETRPKDVKTGFSFKPPADPPPSSKEVPLSPLLTPYAEEIPEDRRYQSKQPETTSCFKEEHDYSYEHHRRHSKTSIVEKTSRPPSTRPPSRMQVSPPGSRRASRKLSALFKLREKNSVPLLNQKLLDHQEELRRSQKELYGALETIPETPPEKSPRTNEDDRESMREVQPQTREGAESVCNQRPEKVQTAEKGRNERSKDRQKVEMSFNVPPTECCTAETVRSGGPRVKQSIESIYNARAEEIQRGVNSHKERFEDKQKDETIYNIRPNECYKAEARRNSGPEVKERA